MTLGTSANPDDAGAVFQRPYPVTIDRADNALIARLRAETGPRTRYCRP